jgi:DNA processing protein
MEWASIFGTDALIFYCRTFEDSVPSYPDLRDHLTLALVPGLGPKLTAAALEKFGSASAVLKASVQDLLTIPLVGDKLANSFVESFRRVNVDAELKLIEKHNVENLIRLREGYPERLVEIPASPPLIYYRGTFSENDRNSIGIVGSRACTSYGKKTAERIATGLARAGWTVISGLARGIDGVAHEAALAAGGRTLAVLAGGLSRIYPPEHKDLAERIVSNGAILTETPMTVDPQPGMFPARNRIISGLSRGVVIIEANAKSGALITATHAADQGRDVFVIPGNVDSPASAGCLELLRKGARLVRDADDILEDVKGLSTESNSSPLSSKASLSTSRTSSGSSAKQATQSPVKQPTQSAGLFDASAKPVAISNEPPPGLNEQQLRIWKQLDQSYSLDELTRLLAIPAGELSMLLTQMEFRKAVRRLPGNRFERR